MWVRAHVRVRAHAHVCLIVHALAAARVSAIPDVVMTRSHTRVHIQRAGFRCSEATASKEGLGAGCLRQMRI